jgi:hypothetical protein
VTLPPTPSIVDNKTKLIEFVLYIATADAEKDAFAKIAQPSYCWSINSADDGILDAKCSAFQKTPEGRHTDELVPQLARALTVIPESSAVYVVTDVSFFADILNTTAASRVASGYKRKDKKPLAYREAWIAVDKIVGDRLLSISAGRPRNAKEARVFADVKDEAKECARNIGVSPGQWNVR